MKINQYQQRTSVGVTQMPRANATNVVGIGSSLAGVAGALQDTININNQSQILDAQILKQQQQKDDAAFAGFALSNGQVHWMEQMKERQEQATGAASGFAKTTLDDYDKWQAEQIEASPEGAKPYMTDRLTALRTSIYGQALNFEAQTRLSYRNNQADQTINNNAQIVYQDPEAFTKVYAENRATIEAMDMPPKLKSQKLQQLNDALTTATVAGMIERNPEVTANMLRGSVTPEVDKKGNPIAPKERGLRNNNPLNIEKSSTAWKGEVSGSDSRFATFSTPEAGIRAAGKNLITYQDKYGLNTIDDIINRWAPPSEAGNDTEAYAKTVAKAVGVKTDDVINVKDPAVMSKMIAAMVGVENGKNPYSDAQIKQGAELAINGGELPKGEEQPQASPDMVASTGNLAIDSLPWQKRIQLLNQAETAAEQQKAALTQQNEIYGSNLEINVNRGASSYQDIDNAFSQGLITASKRTQLTLNLDKQEIEKRKEAEKLTLGIDVVTSSLNGGRKLDYKNTDDKKAVNNYFSQVLAQSIKDMPSDAQSQTIANFAGQTGILPEVVQGQIRGALRSGSPDEIAFYSDMLDRVKTANPSVVNDFSAAEIATGNMVNTYVRAGMEPKDAISLAYKNLQVTPQEHEARQKRYDMDKNYQGNLTYLKVQGTGSSMFGWFGQSLPEKIPDQMNGEFESLVRAEYERSGDIEPARKTALEIMRKTWGVSNIGGDKWMKYPPEQVYAVAGENGDWIKNQLYKEFTTSNWTSGEDINLTLQSDSLSARQENPSYIILQEKEGVFNPIFDANGKPMRFRPDYQSSDAYAKRLKEQKELDLENGKILETVRNYRNKPMDIYGL